MDEFNNEKEKGKNVYKILFISVFVILIGLIGYLTFTRVLDSKKLFGKQEEPQTTNQEVKKDEIAIPAIKKDIVEKINAILYRSSEGDNTIYNANALGFNIDLFKNLSIDSKTKNNIALASAKNKYATPITLPKEKITLKTIIDDYDDPEIRNNEFRTYKQIDQTRVEKIYKDLFNEEITHGDASGICPFYLYDAGAKVYFSIPECGGIWLDQYPIYIDEVYLKDNEAYTYIYLGYIDDLEDNCVDGVCNGNSSYTLYDGIDKTKEIKGIDDYEEAKNYLLTNETKDEFSKYKITFKQDNDKNYYFEKIEEVK